MFGSTSWYNATLKKAVITFGSIFNDIYISRTDNSNNVTAQIKVPINFAPKDKLIVRLDQDPNLDAQASIVLPAIAFEVLNIAYSADNKLKSLERIVKKDNDNTNKLRVLYTAVPYTIEFGLYIYSKNIEDANKILEQILPFFNPDWTPTVELVPEMNESRDTPIILKNISIEDKYDGRFEQRRVFIYTLTFSLLTYFYGPVRRKPIIKFSYIDFAAGNQGEADFFETQLTTPGLLANGSPTTNSASSIDVRTISIDSDFGYCVDLSTQSQYYVPVDLPTSDPHVDGALWIILEYFVCQKDNTMSVNNIAQILDMSEMTSENNLPIFPKQEDLFMANNDFEFTRSNLIELINKTKNAMDDMYILASSSQDEKYYDVYGKLVKTLIEANKELLALQKSIRDINNMQGEHITNKTTNQLIITSDQLLKMIKGTNENQ